MTLQVYGRTEYAEPLTEIATAEDDTDLLAAFAGEWVELVAFPEDAIRWIIRDGARVDSE